MNIPSNSELFLDDLRRGLALYPGNRADLLDEVRDHLLDAMERAQRDGCAPEEAESRVLKAFGDPRQFARQCVAQRNGRRVRWLLPIAVVLGLAMAFVDSRPTWDDTGISAFAILITTGILGLMVPSRPWMWALAIGLWFPLFAILSDGNYGACIALLVACIGAYAGSFMRRLAAS